MKFRDLNMQPINLNMPDILKAARAAYDKSELQAQTMPDVESCLYAGPCAIGVAIDPKFRSELDVALGGEPTISTLANSGLVVFPDDDQKDDARLLQFSHDAWIGAHPEYKPGYEAHFKDQLVVLEEKYA